MQLSASVLLKSLTKLPGASEDAQLSYTPGLGGFQILCGAVWWQCHLPAHCGGWVRTISGENNPHLCVLWGVRSCLLRAPSQTSSFPSGRLGSESPREEKKRQFDDLECAVQDLQGDTVSATVTTVKVPSALQGQGQLLPG